MFLLTCSLTWKVLQDLLKTVRKTLQLKMKEKRVFGLCVTCITDFWVCLFFVIPLNIRCRSVPGGHPALPWASQNLQSWKGPISIMESSSWPCAGALGLQETKIFLSACGLGTVGVCCVHLPCNQKSPPCPLLAVGHSCQVQVLKYPSVGFCISLMA